MSKSVKILSFESSCDDTSVAVLEASGEADVRILGLSTQSQNEVHEKFGGIVPELASRAHLQNLLPCLQKALTEARVDLSSIDIIAATSQPGLIGSLLVGHSAAKTLSFVLGKAFISVNHLEGHIYSVFLEERPKFPFLSLVVSGGHTSLYKVNSFHFYEILGQSLDDAAGEAFDKGAKLLGLGFPGGAELESLASSGDPSFYSFGKVQVPGFHFSFSGLKSEFYRLVQKEKGSLRRADAAASYQRAILSHIEVQLRKALAATQIPRLCIVGGVARNKKLRELIGNLKEEGVLKDFFAPSPFLCTDNAAMIGFVAYQRSRIGEFSSLDSDVASTVRPSREEIRREKKA